MRPVATIFACAAVCAAHHPARSDRAAPMPDRPVYRVTSSTADGSFVIAASSPIPDQIARMTPLGAAVRLDASLIRGGHDEAR